nr:immunoglobulin light chain junction region [Macaca mulatta]MOX73289.1 immunoglobulin light chain junction region [Macaca mulatta]MOX76546.1 immunoglobulin light chain junction region [Macaca mulatta]
DYYCLVWDMSDEKIF